MKDLLPDWVKDQLPDAEPAVDDALGPVPREAEGGDTGSGSEPTSEVFIDPATGQRMRVWYDPATGDREYRAE